MLRGHLRRQSTRRSGRPWKSTRAVLHAEHVAERERHGAPAGAARQHQRAVDVEQDQLDHDQNLILPNRGSVNRPVAGSSVRRPGRHRRRKLAIHRQRNRGDAPPFGDAPEHHAPAARRRRARWCADGCSSTRIDGFERERPRETDALPGRRAQARRPAGPTCPRRVRPRARARSPDAGCRRAAARSRARTAREVLHDRQHVEQRRAFADDAEPIERGEPVRAVGDVGGRRGRRREPFRCRAGSRR